MLSCSKKAKDGQTTEDINEIYKDFMFQNIGEESYTSIYGAANDSVKNWVNHGLRIAKMQKYSSEWTIDSVVCINTRKDKSIMAILNKKSSTVSNSINYLYGVKVDGTWYFFYGPTIYVDSGMNGKNAKSFDELHEIALKKVFRGYLKKSPTGEWEINERFFNQMINKNNPDAIGDGPKGGHGSCFHCKTFEEYVLYLSAENWKDRDTTNAATPVLDQ